MKDLIIEPAQTPAVDPQAVPFEYPKEAIVSYAQTHEDVLLWRALHNVQGGFYVDVGAHDPTVLSVTRAFYDHGWRGINVEPDPLYAEKLRRDRPRDETQEVALGRKAGMATFYEFGDTGLSTLVTAVAQRHMAAGFKATERRVLVTTLAALLDDLGDQQVHFLKIDVEGSELQVLSGADFAKVRPWIIIVEAVSPMTTTASYSGWESLLFAAGYEFAYFDGLNRYYIAQEHSTLQRFFSVPVSACDPFRDNEIVRLAAAVAELERNSLQQATLIGRLSGVMVDLEHDRMTQTNEANRLREVVAEFETRNETQTNEANRLRELVAEFETRNETQANESPRVSAVISEVYRDREPVTHEMPRLLGKTETPIACDIEDAAGLLRIVEAQAADLIRLRRALVSAQTVSAQRLEIIRAEANAHENRGESKFTVSEWVRSMMLGEITRIQDAISDVIRLSRWRHVGQRLGLAKRLDWETSNWQTDVTDGGTRRPSTAELLVELKRLHGLLDHMRLSRWRKLGHWLGLAKRLPWETGAWAHPLLVRPYPSEGSDRSAVARASTLLSSYSGFVEYANERFLDECRGFATDVILDVGANVGQFARGLRASGYQGHIISFEPLSSAHKTLVSAAASDPLWDVADRCAVGASDGFSSINIAGNSFSSSLLPMLELHRDAAPQSEYQGTEPCRVIALDSYIEQTFSDRTVLFGLKMDTQGYEAQVLAGLRQNHNLVKVIVCEMSLAPLYAHGPSMSELSHQLAEFGYRCVALSPEFEDPRTGELLQVNGVFVQSR